MTSTRQKIIYLLFGLIFLICMGGCSIDKNPLAPSGEGIHIRQGFSDFGAEYKFKDMPADIGFVPTFPRAVVEDLPDSIKKKVTIEYWLYTSIEDAELSMVERLDISNLFMKNMIDFPLSGGRIGDNCWHQFKVGAIQFIRNNVLVSVTSSGGIPVDSSEIELVARKVDTVIINAEKVASGDLLPAPVIYSVDIISDLPADWGQPFTVKVSASDPKSQKLWFRKYASNFAAISETGVLIITLNRYADSSKDPNKAKVKIWVWNEDNLVSSVEKEIPFR